MTSARFDSSRLKLARAREHTYALGRAVQAFHATNPYRTERQPSPESVDEHWVRLVEATPPPVAQWALLVGDAAHCIRVALDHAIWDLAQPVPAKLVETVSFPIQCDPLSPKGKPRRLPGWMADVLTPLVVAFVETLQPRHHRDLDQDPLDHPLARIHDLDRIDKHRHLSVITHTFDRSTLSWRNDLGSAVNIFRSPRDGFQPGEVLHSIPATAGNLGEVDSRFEVEIEVERLPRGNPVEALNVLISYAETDVLTPLEQILGSAP